jgi:hypothetical protein
MSATSSTEPKSLGELQQRVAALNGAMQRSTVITVALGIVALLMLIFYFNYAYREVVDLTTPDSVVTLVDGVLSDNLPSAREALSEQIKESSPEWAKELSVQAQESIPQLRAQIEDFVVAQVDEQLAEVELVSEEEFRKFLTENKDELRKQVKLLAEGKQVPEETMKEFVDSFDKQFEVSFKETTNEMYETLFEINSKLVRLQANEQLSPEEQQERRLIMLAKAVQAQTAASAAEPAPTLEKQAALKPVAERE